MTIDIVIARLYDFLKHVNKKEQGIHMVEAHKKLQQSSETAIRDFEKKVTQAQRALDWENFWPRTIVPVRLAAAFTAATASGAVSALPPFAQASTLLLSGVLMLYSIRKNAEGFRRATRQQAIDRIDEKSGLPHRPANRLDDRPAETSIQAQKLWETNRQKIIENDVPAMKVGAPSPNMPARDPYALRFVPALALATGLMMAGNQTLDRMTGAFTDIAFDVTPRSIQVDAFVIPPSYTEQEPFSLTDKDYTVPQGSTLNIRAYDKETKIDLSGGAVLKGEPDIQHENDIIDYKIDLSENSVVHVQTAVGDGPRWKIDVTPDQPPAVLMTQERTSDNKPTRNMRYVLSDEYGARLTDILMHAEQPPQADAGQEEAEPLRRSLTGGPARPLYNPDTLRLKLD